MSSAETADKLETIDAIGEMTILMQGIRYFGSNHSNEVTVASCKTYDMTNAEFMQNPILEQPEITFDDHETGTTKG